MILMDLLENNFRINQGIINILEQLMNRIYQKWCNKLTKRRKRLTEEENSLFKLISPFEIFQEIINNKKNYKDVNNFKEKLREEYDYFTQGYNNKTLG